MEIQEVKTFGCIHGKTLSERKKRLIIGTELFINGVSALLSAPRCAEAYQNKNIFNQRS